MVVDERDAGVVEGHGPDHDPDLHGPRAGAGRAGGPPGDVAAPEGVNPRGKSGERFVRAGGQNGATMRRKDGGHQLGQT